MIEELLDVEEEKALNHNSSSHNDLITAKFHQLINGLQKEGVDYQVVGAFSAYLKYHDEYSYEIPSISIHLNEKDMECFKKICHDLSFDVRDNRLSSPKTMKNGIIQGNQEVTVYDGESLFLNVFCFERLVDGTILSKEYYQDDEHNFRVKESIFSSKLAKEIFERDSVLFFGYMIPIVSFEYLSIIRLGDSSFNDFIQTKINERRQYNIQNLMKTDKIIQYVPVHELPESSYSFKTRGSNINQILLDSTREFSETENLEFLKTKQIHKIDESYESGSITRYAVVVILLSIMVLIFIILILIKIFG